MPDRAESGLVAAEQAGFAYVLGEGPDDVLMADLREVVRRSIGEPERWLPEVDRLLREVEKRLTR